jgi:hypothetical protein
MELNRQPDIKTTNSIASSHRLIEDATRRRMNSTGTLRNDLLRRVPVFLL